MDKGWHYKTGNIMDASPYLLPWGRNWYNCVKPGGMSAGGILEKTRKNLWN